MLRRSLLAAALLVVAIAAGADARASVSVAVTFDALVRDTTSCGVMTPVEQQSLWENGRIVTYTRVHVDRAVAGDLRTGSDALVATLGGKVGTVGQTVDGEPQLTVGAPALLFLRPDRVPGLLIVTARAQGAFPLRGDGRFVRSNAVGVVLTPRGAQAAESLAQDVLAERPVEDAARSVAAVWGRWHVR